MEVSALLTSAGINIGICITLLSLYSILRKQPGNVGVYFSRKLLQEHVGRNDPFCFDRLFPSPSWIKKAIMTSEEEIMSVCGLDAVVFLRIIVFSIRIFSIAAVICIFLVLPLNYFGQDMIHKKIPSESLDVFTIANVEEASKWLWAHCLALYVITCSACILLYFEYKTIARLRLEHITRSAPHPSHFSILVRAIPRSAEESYSTAVDNFFTKYHASSYLSHQIVYRSGTVQKLMKDAQNMCKRFSQFPTTSIVQSRKACILRCGLCGGTTNSFKKLSNEVSQRVEDKSVLAHLDSDTSKTECASAIVFFKTRYGAVVASQLLQSSNPMIWVTDLAPAPCDVYWSNLWIPYEQLWLRRIGTLSAAIIFMLAFLVPVTFVQGLSQLNKLQQWLPFLRGILRKRFISQLVTGYLPSVILMLFLYAVAPTMMLFSAIEGNISRSERKRSACTKVLYFMVWNVFIANVLSGTAISQIHVISDAKNIPTILAKAVPGQATFFTTYILTSGWASLSSEVMQLFALLYNLFVKYMVRSTDGSWNYTLTFPYHTEVPKALLFGLLGFTCSILAPLILPFLLAYFFLGYIVYRNQLLNVYITKYETGGQYWPIMHNTTIFSLVLAQIIALGVFGIKKSPIASGFTIPLVILTLLFNAYCRKRFSPVFNSSYSAQDLIEMDRRDEQSGRMSEIHQQLQSAYCQTKLSLHKVSKAEGSTHCTELDISEDTENMKSGIAQQLSLGRVPISAIRQVVTWLSMVIAFQDRKLPE